MMREKKLTSVRAAIGSIWADCGKVIDVHAKVTFRKDSDLMTHDECRAWWWNLEIPQEDADDDIPF